MYLHRRTDPNVSSSYISPFATKTIGHNRCRTMLNSAVNLGDSRIYVFYCRNHDVDSDPIAFPSRSRGGTHCLRTIPYGTQEQSREICMQTGAVCNEADMIKSIFVPVSGTQ